MSTWPDFQYIICGDEYFDFAGKSGLISTIAKFVPANHWLPTIVKDPAYTDALDKLSALRNFAAHDNAVSKRRARNAIGQDKIHSSGAWLKKQKRLDRICAKLNAMADQIEAAAPY